MISKQQVIKPFCTFASNFTKTIKSYKEVPTLRQFPLLGHSYLFLPGGNYMFKTILTLILIIFWPGKYKSEKLTEAIHDISKTLGPIFKLNLGGMDILITINANHTEAMYRNEGRYPKRPAFPALLHYRKKTFNSAGVVPGNGEEWHHFRKGVNPLLKTQLVSCYADQHESIAKDFVKYINRTKHKDLLEDIFTHLLKYSIEGPWTTYSFESLLIQFLNCSHICCVSWKQILLLFKWEAGRVWEDYWGQCWLYGWALFYIEKSFVDVVQKFGVFKAGVVPCYNL